MGITPNKRVVESPMTILRVEPLPCRDAILFLGALDLSHHPVVDA
jgi:hypothetical protein